MIRDDDFEGFLLDRIGGTPTMWSCIWCFRHASAVAEIEHPDRCPIARLAAAEAQNAELRAAGERIVPYLYYGEDARCAECDEPSDEACKPDCKVGAFRAALSRQPAGGGF